MASFNQTYRDTRMEALKNMSTGRLIFQAAVGYGLASYVSYKYNLITKAQTELRDIKDKKLFLFKVHEKTAESYDSSTQRRELSNKIQTYRKVLLSYAEGKVLECGIGTGRTLRFYDSKLVKHLTGVDWSPAMLQKAFERVDELQTKNEIDLKKE